MKSFVYEALPSRVVFGENAVEHLPREIEQLGARRALVLSTPGRQELANGKIREIREYCDSVLTEKALGRFPQSHGAGANATA